MLPRFNPLVRATRVDDLELMQSQWFSSCVNRGFNLGPPIASEIKSALLFANCDTLGVKIIRIDPLEPNIWLHYVYCAVLQLFF